MSSGLGVIHDPATATLLTTLDEAVDQLGTACTPALSNQDRLLILQRLETLSRTMSGIGLALIAQMDQQWSRSQFCCPNLYEVLADSLRISPGEARARARHADAVTPQIAITGQPLPPQLPATAAAVRDGAISTEHVHIITTTMRELPGIVDTETRSHAEEFLATHARVLRPDHLRQAARKLETILNPDGRYSDADRAGRRGVHLGRQSKDLMSKATITADPELRAYLEAVFGKYAAPGVLNSDDTHPSVDPDAATQHRDTRTVQQRQHDALKAVLRDSIASGRLGQHRGLPVTVVVSMSLQELQDATTTAAAAADDPAAATTTTTTNSPTPPARHSPPTSRCQIINHRVCGPAVTTGGGALLPISDALRLAAHAHHYLAIFDDRDGRPLYLGRSKRIASADQRLVLHARDVGCTHPGCTTPGYLCQTHHRRDWALGGTTDADQLTFVCDRHHQQAGSNDHTWTATATPPTTPPPDAPNGPHHSTSTPNEHPASTTTTTPRNTSPPQTFNHANRALRGVGWCIYAGRRAHWYRRPGRVPAGCSLSEQSRNSAAAAGAEPPALHPPRLCREWLRP